MIVTPFVGSLRNANSSTNPSFGIAAGLSDVVSAYRPYIAFLDLQPTIQPLGLVPYSQALIHIVPLLHNGTDNGFIRSTVYITQQVSPISAELNIGIGGSAVGESYDAFGIGGVVGTFTALGVLMAVGEICAFERRQIWAVLFIILTFSSILFYLRDDIFGLLRPIVWGLIIAVIVAKWANPEKKRIAKWDRQLTALSQEGRNSS